ncbi:Disease resistance protein [Quillaja saponaria]|uniref:Disease resistance protein n=1 Tax=Quillaja saponaria TaxID=32244 RepID=A0AAD7KX19_QUISA|nr:Disease resistance protein [Quillaja saponaria]
MAAEVVGGAVLSSFLAVLFNRMAKPEVVNFLKGKKLDEKLLRRLKTALLAVRPLLNDAEKKQIRDPDVKEWLDELNDIVYHADDLLDEIAARARTATKEVPNNFFFTSFSSYDRELSSRTEDVIDRIESIIKYKDVLKLEEGFEKKLSDIIPSTSLVEASDVVGREQDKEAIVNLLLSDSESGNKVSVIPIVGMGGIGKTTLAQLVYDDDKVKQKFDLKAWVCVSEELDVLKVTETVLEAVTFCSRDTKDLNVIQLELKKRLIGKKFLLVLDNVWNENYDNWEILRRPFNYGAEGSKIIVTTRSKKVALIMQTTPPHHLEHLSEDDCWLIFSKHAFCFSDSNEYPVLEKIGKEIVKKCRGLPLAAKTLGGLLRSKSDVEEWNSILKTDIWSLSEDESKIVPALRISYHYLPSNLKQCFLYCSIFPKDYWFIKEDLILLWMAENFLQPPKREKRLEDVGYEYFNDLASRSFFQPVRNKGSRFVMHDLIHDLAKDVAGEFSFMSEGDDVHEVTKKTRYLSFKHKYPVLKDFEGFSEAKYLRTLLLQDPYESIYLQEKVPNVILPKLKCLRVLSLPYGDFETLPNSIGQLIHLRYLDVSYTKIKELHESVCDLYNLQTLKLQWCARLTMLPSAMPNLINLRYLDIYGSGIKELPKGISKFNCLQFLSEFSVGKKKVGAQIGELGTLPDLGRRLSIDNLQYVVNAKDASKARLKDKKYVWYLELRWGTDTNIDDSQHERDILDQLQPHPSLKSLYIIGYRGTTFPDWLGHASYHNMVSLRLHDCKYCCLLPSLGQLPFLETLIIHGLGGLVTIGNEFYKNDNNSSLTTVFRCLESLYFSNMPIWEQWSSFEGIQGDVFPRLGHLYVVNCPRLIRDLPNSLPALEVLHIKGCPNLVSSLPRALVIRSLCVENCESLMLSQQHELEELLQLVGSLKIEGCYLVKSVFEAMAMYNDFTTCLEKMSISSCSFSISFPGGYPPNSLKTLHISKCEKFEFPSTMHHHQSCHVSLESLKITESCDSLTTLEIDAYPNLKTLHIEGCENFASFSVCNGPLQQLDEIVIRNCVNFISFPKEGLPAPCLSILIVSGCYNLKSLPNEMHSFLPNLKSLRLGDCPEIESFPEGGLPSNLSLLEIRNCGKLVDRRMDWNLHASLSKLLMYGKYENVESFPEESLLPTSLTYLSLTQFSSLQKLDNKGMHNLVSLEQLDIANCPRLESLTKERLPASLMKLIIKGCPLLEEVSSIIIIIISCTDAASKISRRERVAQEEEKKWVYDASLDYIGRVPLHVSTTLWKASFL